MTLAHACPRCSKPLPDNAPEGLCPACLVLAALPGESAPASEPAEAGTRLKYFGDYELLGEVARGGMGVVYKARQTKLNRIVAVKMIRAGALAGPDEVRRFHREAEAAANLQHPGIVAVHEVGEHEGRHYFSMDFVEGRDLGAIAAEGPLTAARAARYVKEVAEAVHFAHQRGTLHRDLKPQNVLIDADDRPRVTDFGLAKLSADDSRITQTGVVMGSPSYMPPEQAAGRPADVGPHSDVYALGAILYELLTGRPPFAGTTAMATLLEVMEAEPVPPRELKADVPRDLETICLKCLEKRRAARYSSARELAEELDRYLKGEPILARPAGVVRRAVSWGRRHPGYLAAAVALLVIGLAFGGVYLFEENSYLRARLDDPTLTRQKGPRHAAVREWDTVNVFVWLSGILALAFRKLQAKRITWKDLFDTEAHLRPSEPISDRMWAFVVCAGLACVVCGAVFLVKVIQAQVWEGGSTRHMYWQVFLLVWWGLMTLGFAAEDYQLAQYGHPVRHLTAEQLEPIRRSLEEFDVPGAILHYGRAVPDADDPEAREYVLRLAKTLRAREPEKFTPPTLSLASLNGRAMLICVAIQGVILAGVSVLMPSFFPAWFGFHFGAGYLFGMGILTGMRDGGLWPMMLLVLTSLATMALSEVVRPIDSLSFTKWPMLVGLVFGACLMISAFTPRRRGLRKS